MRTLSARGGWLAGGVAVALLAGGCGSRHQFGQVEGVVTLDGKPLAEAGVAFLPDSTKGNFGPGATAVTDDLGRFKLEYTIVNDSDLANPRTGDGALVGWHRVLVDDYRMKRDQTPPPGRVPMRYESLEETPLLIEVKPGQQAVTLELKSR